MSDLVKLKQRIENLEKENQLLKKSLFELSLKTNSNKSIQPFQLKELLEDNGMVGAARRSPTPSLSNLQHLQRYDRSMNALTFKAEEDSRHHHHYISGKTEKNKSFYLKSELKGHAGAIYTVKFSPCGRWIASGSFDRTVRIWDANSPKELNCLQGHGLNISEVSWSKGSDELLSGGYDQTCRVWDVEHAKQLESFESDGFVQCVQFCPINSQLFFCGTSRNILSMIDRRQPSSASMNLRNESMVNTVSVFNNGTHVVSGDATGNLKTWDVRTGKCIQSFLNEASKKPISHIATCPSNIPDEEPRYMAVNSYDNVMRVYDRGSVLPSSPYTLIHALKGYKNKNWPIRSCFYNFPSFGRGTSAEDVGLIESNQRDISVDKASESRSLLATGSADPFVYVYNLGQNGGTSNLLQRLEGHTDRVYTCHFHPSEPLLASGSADFTLKLWTLKRKSKS